MWLVMSRFPHRPLPVDNSASCVFTPMGHHTVYHVVGRKASVKITDDATNGNDLRISSIIVTTNNDMQIYKVTQSAITPDGITHDSNTTNNVTSVGITYGTGFIANSSDEKIYPNPNTSTKNASVYRAMGYWWETNSQTWPNVTIGSENIIPRTVRISFSTLRSVARSSRSICAISNRPTIYVLRMARCREIHGP
jgi:hypothetical protein